ncbi:MAG: hypothetical protein EHM84_00840 [Lysobacterales bacterium]|nr:MAG: hypothetical protein EHM84_00840 [Xanthomonadales bacterium]
MGVPDYCVHPSDCQCESCAGFRCHERDATKRATELVDLRATVARLTEENERLRIEVREVGFHVKEANSRTSWWAEKAKAYADDLASMTRERDEARAALVRVEWSGCNNAGQVWIEGVPTKLDYVASQRVCGALDAWTAIARTGEARLREWIAGGGVR